MNTPIDGANLYREAARLVAEKMWAGREHRTCCTAIDDVAGAALGLEYRQRFARMFAPDGAGLYVEWFGASDERENRPPRVLALCFMAAMVEAGDA